MDRYKALSRGTQVMFVAGVLLLVDTFLSWQKVEFAGIIPEITLNAWHGFWGVLLGLLTIALLAWLAASMLGVVMRLPVSDMLLSAVLGAAIVICALLKVLTDEFTAMWAWIGLVLAAAVAVGAWLRVQEAGGMDKLRAEATSMTGSHSEAPPPPPPAQEPPAS
jgi:hypothetical protein